MRKPIKVIAVTGGKGGVGKTNVSVNLAVSLAKLNKRVLLLDADLGLANVDILLGLSVKKNLADVLNGDCDMRDVLVDGPGGIKIVPASSGIQKLAEVDAQSQNTLIQAFDWLSDQVDILIIDTAAGISPSVTRFLTAAQHILVVLSNEPTSITDAYALIKVMSQEYAISRFHVLPNMVKDDKEARQVFSKLLHASDRFLDVVLDYAGYLPFDEHLRKAVRKQRCVVDLYPSCASSGLFSELATTANSWPIPDELSGQVSFFMQQLGQNTPLAASLN